MPFRKLGNGTQMTSQNRTLPAVPNFIWNTLPQRFGRFSSLLGVVLQDGRYLSGLPILGNSAAIVGLSSGLTAGFADRGGLPFTTNLVMLAVLLMLGILSGQAGFWAFVGFVVADTFGLIGEDAGTLSLGYAGAVIISWFFLFQLVVGLPQAARFMGGFNGRLALLNGLITAIFVGAFAELWTRLSMVALRPLFTWQGADAPLELVEFIDPRNEWMIGDLAFHKLAWLALAAGLARWILTPLIMSFAAPVSALEHNQGPKIASKVPFGLAAFGKAASFTAIVAGVFTTIVGALVFFLSITGVVAFRGYASANRVVAQWDGLMLRIPSAIRLFASYALGYYLAEALDGFFRDTLEWRTMTVAGVAIAATFSVSLLFWPQVSPAHDAPTPPEALRRLFRGTGKIAPRAALFVLMLGGSAAYAHHCSFEPGCECLRDNGALAALVAGAASLAQLLISIPAGSMVADPLPGAVPGNNSLLTELNTKLDQLRFATDAGQSARLTLELFDLLKQAKDAAELWELVGTLGVDVGVRTPLGQSVGGALTILVDPILDHLFELAPSSTLATYSKAVLAAGLKNAVYISTLDLAGASTNLGFQFIDIVLGIDALRAESLARVTGRLEHAIIVTDAMHRDQLSEQIVLQDVERSRAIEAELDPSLFNPIEQRASQQINIINDLLDLAVRQKQGENVQVDIERLSQEYSRYNPELSGIENIANYYDDFAAQVAVLLGVQGW